MCLCQELQRKLDVEVRDRAEEKHKFESRLLNAKMELGTREQDLGEELEVIKVEIGW